MDDTFVATCTSKHKWLDTKDIVNSPSSKQGNGAKVLSLFYHPIAEHVRRNDVQYCWNTANITGHAEYEEYLTISFG